MTAPVDELVLANIVTMLATMARYKGSLAARIRPEAHNEVVTLVAANMVPDFEDLEAAIIAALGRVRHSRGDLFNKDRPARLFGFRAANWKE